MSIRRHKRQLFATYFATPESDVASTGIIRLSPSAQVAVAQMSSVDSTRDVVGLAFDGSDNVVIGDAETAKWVTVRSADSGFRVKDAAGTNRLAVDFAGSKVALAWDLDLGDNKIENVAEPTNPSDAATKAYVDAAVSGSGGASTTTTASFTIPPFQAWSAVITVGSTAGLPGGACVVIVDDSTYYGTYKVYLVNNSTEFVGILMHGWGSGTTVPAGARVVLTGVDPVQSGTATLVNGTATVSWKYITSNTRIMLTVADPGTAFSTYGAVGVIAPVADRSNSLGAGSFVIKAIDATGTPLTNGGCVVEYMISG